MKKLLYILIALAAVACFAACEKETPVSTPKLAVVNSNLDFDCSGGTGTIVVEAEGAVTAASDKPWAQVSVSGNTISVTCGAWTGLESRNAKITLTAAGETRAITAIQRGVVFSLDGVLMSEGLVFTGAGKEHSYPFTTSTPVTEVTTGDDWFTVSCDNATGAISIVTSDNTDMATRHGSFVVTVGDARMEYKVSQYPPFKETKDWSMSLVSTGEESTVLKATVKAANGYYFADYAKPSAIAKAASVEAFVETVLVPSIRTDMNNAIVAYSYRYGYTSFLSNKTADWTFDPIPDGDYVGFMIGFDKDGYPTGWYSATDIFIGEVTPYMKWLGTWSVPKASGTPETWTIEKKEEDKSYWVSGINGLNPGVYTDNDFRAEMKFDAKTGELVVAVWENTAVTWTDASRGTCNTLLTGNYTNVAGSTYYNSGVGNVIARLKLSADGGSATVTPASVTSGGAPATFHNIRWYARYTTSSGSRSGFGWTGVETPISAGMVLTKQ